MTTPHFTSTALAACLVSIWLGGCDDNSQGMDDDTVYRLDTTLTLYPMTVGDRTEYAEDSLSSDGGVRSVRHFGPFDVTRSDSASGVIRFWEAGWNSWLWKGDGGVWTKAEAVDLDTTQFLLWKWPCKVGDMWTARLISIKDYELQMSVKAVDAVITTPTRTDTCIVYEARHAGSVVYVQYVAPGFGWLREDQYLTKSTVDTIGTGLLPLISYPRYRQYVSKAVRSGTVP